MAKVTIINGPARVEIENGDAQTVRELLAAVRDEMNIGDGANPILNGQPVALDTVVDGDAELAFTKPTGQKGDTVA